MGEPVFAFLAAAHSFRYRMDGCKSFCAGICGTLWIDTPDVGIAYRLLAGILARHCGRDSELSRAPGDDWKGKLSTAIYVIAIIIALWLSVPACALHGIWFIPDRCTEKKVLK